MGKLLDKPPVSVAFEKQVIMAYCDGGIMGQSPSRYGGAWAWCHVDGLNKRVKEKASLIMPTESWPTLTNNYVELVAAIRALEALPEGWNGVLGSDSQITLGRLFEDWHTEGIPDGMVARAKKALARLGKVKGVLLGGHPTLVELERGYNSKGRPVSEHNVWCDKECQRFMAHYIKDVMRCGGFDERGISGQRGDVSGEVSAEGTPEDS
jgi:ribonuclease HI